jgi:hypothetical protein
VRWLLVVGRSNFLVSEQFAPLLLTYVLLLVQFTLPALVLPLLVVVGFVLGGAED